MASDYPNKAEEREAVFVRQLVATTRTMRYEFREWIQQELIELTLVAQLAESTSRGSAKDAIQQDLNLLGEINLHGLPTAIKALDEEIERVSGGAYDDVLDAYHYMQDMCSRLERFTRQLLEIKRRLAAYAGPRRQD